MKTVQGVNTFAFKHLAASMGDFSSVDFDLLAELYLTAYQTHRSLDSTNLDYYRSGGACAHLSRVLKAKKSGSIH